jgi:hypothetical protein
VTVAGGNRLDGLWFETWSRLSRHGVCGHDSIHPCTEGEEDES